MKLNKKGKPYVEPDPARPCHVVDRMGLFYHPTTAPAGFCKCGVILKLNTQKKEYVFQSHAKAIHAKEHTIRWLKENGFEPVDYDNFIIEYVKQYNLIPGE